MKEDELVEKLLLRFADLSGSRDQVVVGKFPKANGDQAISGLRSGQPVQTSDEMYFAPGLTDHQRAEMLLTAFENVKELGESCEGMSSIDTEQEVGLSKANRRSTG